MESRKDYSYHFFDVKTIYNSKLRYMICIVVVKTFMGTGYAWPAGGERKTKPHMRVEYPTMPNHLGTLGLNASKSRPCPVVNAKIANNI
ncbi:hypothetical protein BDV37DRAFT_209980 [Aspergillus pseudonomiae]|uniref:Uncharacterized protein n=1 Tax=Aspergillus pseudonomiae TaxID=1506151 RepID=A0A5N7D1F4_9EURO|nr:uncharacterized protein BDV37DRAFT_209980 [Aspergillus pseudonomiae]KAE8400245.1 hypothetical protein BDV37DRAFT_209980 [Aspergillus pseudonomiae]